MMQDPQAMQQMMQMMGTAAGGKCPLPCLRTPPHAPAWFQGPGPLLRTLERRLSSF